MRNKEHAQDHVTYVSSVHPSGDGTNGGTAASGRNLAQRPEAYSGFDVDTEQFAKTVLAAYQDGHGSEQPADDASARSLIPPGTGMYRDFSYVANELPHFMPEDCVACMDCVTACPDTAILGKVSETDQLEDLCGKIENPAERGDFRAQWVETTKFHKIYEKKGDAGGQFAIYIDPSKCKGCGECVDVCGEHNALKMVPKEPILEQIYSRAKWMRSLPETPARFLSKNLPIDSMLKETRALLYTGGAGSCAGCGEATAIRMMLAATGEAYEREDIGIVAATGCNTVYGSTYPYNPYLVTWSNSLFENAPAMAMGVRVRWDQQGGHHKRLWVLGGDGAMFDIGFQSLSRMLAAGMDIQVLVLDTQVYSNTGGEASTASFTAQTTKMSPYGRVVHGKIERRKELANIALMHPDVYVAQCSTAFANHFYQVIREANEYPGPAVVNVFTTCQPEHGVADDMATTQSKRAVISRAFPLFIHDPRKGESLQERLNLRGNPNVNEDWKKDPKTGEEYTFIDFARTEGRFAKHFDKEGNPSPELLGAKEDRLKNWRLLQELAGVKR